MVQVNKAAVLSVFFILGAITLVIEIAGTRLLAPFYGSTIYVWTGLISVTLAALALGAWIGGYLSDKYPNLRLLFKAIIVAGVVVALLPTVTPVILVASNFGGIVFGPLIASGALFFVPLLILGMMTPFGVKVLGSSLETIGLTAGLIYAVVTAGSLFGSLLTGLYLVPNFSVYNIFIASGLVLVILGLIWQFISHT